ncbi:PPK2 family polyphosphate kinase [Cumulibacter manganitolerans]|uniref:PPK2 family polyphosphate kinase n=1 Tax=Cumulibacter manganitolerans TaxID=1884992 RepID=UPI001295361A|nr:PPK2 family polyphosphate kinase [Cumulibacter manganitolerans]
MSSDKSRSKDSERTENLRAILRVPANRPAAAQLLADLQPGSTPAGPSGKKAAAKAMKAYAGELAGLQERLFANARGGADRRVLLVLQGMDTSGKGGVVEHVLGLVNPGGIRMHAFKAPTEEEKRHDFLWRVRQALPGEGQIGIFDRSHYEDVLIVKVHQLASDAEIHERYEKINAFERELTDDGYTIVKCFLNISKETQKERLLARLDDPQKHWKFNPGDIDERARWDDYQSAYFEALTRCTSDAAPWYAVPSDHKWYRNWAVGQLLLETLRELDPQFPQMHFDVQEQRERLLAAG